MKIIQLALYTLLFTACGVKKDIAINVIPKPKLVETKGGSFSITSNTAIVSKSSQEAKQAKFLIEALEKFNGITLLKKEATKNVILVSLNDSAKSLGNEGYRLIVSKNKIEVIAGKPAGLFYGIQSLIQLCGSNKVVTIPCMRIEDVPRFSWRGMHLDESRHFFGKEFVKKYIDILSLHKLNTFHWHLTDDQGWRIEIKKYPKLTSVGAWREDRRGENWNIDDEQRLPYDGKPLYGGFYTQEDIKEIVAYAQKRHITIVPEIEMPGHSRAALVAYPEFSCFGKETKVPSGGYVGDKWDFSDPYCAGNEETFTFIQNILDEVIALFPSPYIHIGGDECSKRIWKACTKCQARIKNENLKDEFELQSYFVKRIEKHLETKGKRMIGWQEILEGGMNPSALIMPWRGEDALTTALEAAQSGHEVIMATSSFLYFNSSWPTDIFSENDLPLDKVYSYEPIPEGLDKKYHSSIIGLEACIWSELTPTYRDVEYQTMPRIAALSEIGWTEKENKAYTNFESRVDAIKALYKKMNINYFVPSPSGIAAKTVFTETAQMKFEKAPIGTIIRYTLDGLKPDENSNEYTKPVVVTQSIVIKAAAFDRHGQKSKVINGVFEKQEYRKAETIQNAKKGLNYKYFSGRFRGADQMDMATPNQIGVSDTIGALVKNVDGDAGYIFEGYIEVPTDAIYTFYLSSNDGSKMYIGNYSVVDNDGYVSAFTNKGEMILKSGRIALAKGIHPITIKFFDWGSGEFLKAIVEGADMKKVDLNTIILK